MVDLVELVSFDRAQQMRELDRYDARWSQQNLETPDEVVEVWHLGEHVVAKDQVGGVSPRRQLARRLHPEEFYQRLDAFRLGYLCHVCRRLDSKSWDSPL